MANNYTDIKSYLKAQLTTNAAKEKARADEAYVAKVSGKGLSTEDFTTALKTKLENLDTAELTSLKSAVDTLIGSDASKSARAIAAEEVAKVVADADESFDTLKEIADWILNDTTGAAKMANDIAALKTDKQDKITASGILVGDGNGGVTAAPSGKGLSTNDYDDTEKQKVADAAAHASAAHAPSDAEKNVIVGVKLGTGSLTPDADRVVTIALEDLTEADWTAIFA